MSMTPGGHKPAPRWTTQRTQVRRLHVPILRPKVDRPLTVLAIGHEALGCDVHYVNGATIPCGGGPLNCQPCKDGLSWRRTWWLLVATMPALKVSILAITNGAYEACPRLQYGAGQLRGHYIKSWRTGNRVNGPQHVQVQHHCGSENLPSEIDLKEQLAYIWEVGEHKFAANG